MPIRPTARFQALLKYGIGGASLYRHRDLWHPNYFGMDINQDIADPVQQPPVDFGVSAQSNENPPDPPASQTDSQLDCANGASNWHNPPSLLPPVGGDNMPAKDFKVSTPQLPQLEDGNFQAVQNSTQQSRLDIQAQLQARREAVRLANEQAQRIREEAHQSAHIARMQHYLESGDPILMAEALAWVKINPDILQLPGSWV